MKNPQKKSYATYIYKLNLWMTVIISKSVSSSNKALSSGQVAQ